MKFSFTVIVNGNYSDEETENGVVNFPFEGNEVNKGYPLQRDDVQTTPSKNDHNQFIGELN